MRRPILLATMAILVCAPPVAADDAGPGADVRALIAAAPPAAAYPQADAVILWREVSLSVDDAGRLSRREHVLTRLQTQWAMRNLSDARLPWDAERQTLMVHACRTFMADGAEVVSPPNAFNEVTPDAVARAVPFLGVREMVVSHVGTEVGAVLDLDWEVTDLAPGPLPAATEVFLQDRWPVREVVVRVAPATLAAELRLAAGRDVEAATQDDARVWRGRDLPGVPLGGLEARRGEVHTALVVTSAAGGADLARALRAAGDRATAELGAPLAAWLADGQDDLTRLDTVQRIAALACDGVRPIALPTGAWSRAPRPVAEVHASAVATPWEQALLATALLRAAGLAPEVGVFSRGGAAKAAAGWPDEIRVVVPLDGQNWWLAPARAAAWSGGCDLPGATGSFLEDDGGVRTWTVPAGAGRCRFAARIAAPAEGTVRVTADVELDGALRDAAQSARQVAAAVVSRLVAGGEAEAPVVREETPQRLALRVAGCGPVPAPAADGILLVDLPWPRGSVLDRLPVGFRVEEPARAAPLLLDEALTEETTVTLDLAPDQRVDAAPAAIVLSCPAGEYRLEVDVAADAVVLRRTLALRAGRCDPADYPALRAMLAAALRDDRAALAILTR